MFKTAQDGAIFRLGIDTLIANILVMYVFFRYHICGEVKLCIAVG